jgi:hypothetical protein
MADTWKHWMDKHGIAIQAVQYMDLNLSLSFVNGLMQQASAANNMTSV